MAIAVYFAPASMTAEQYDEVDRKLDAVGQASPAGRSYHVSFGEGDKIRVLDIWESQEAFDEFGSTLMPILAEVGIDPGEPRIAPVHNIIS